MKRLMCFFILMFLCSGMLVGLVSAEMEVDINYPPEGLNTGMNYFEKYTYINFTMNNMTELDSCVYKFHAYLDSPSWHNDTTFDDNNVLEVIYVDHLFAKYEYNSSLDCNGDGVVSVEDITNYYGTDNACADLTGNGVVNSLDLSAWYYLVETVDTITFNASLDISNFPFNDCYYSLVWFVQVVSNSTIVVSGAETFGIGEPTSDILYHYAFRNFDPYSYDFGAYRVIGRGLYWECATNRDESRGYHIITTNNDAGTACDDDGRNLIAYGTRNVYADNVTSTEWYTGYPMEEGVYWFQMKGSQSAYDARIFYYNYFGVEHNFGSGSDVHTVSNTRFTLDETADIRSENNWVFCTNGLNTTAQELWESNSCSKYFEFLGFFVYFETFPAEGEDESGWSPDTSGQGDLHEMVDEYGASIGMPYFSTIIGAMIVSLIVCIPLGFSLRNNIDIPSFVYSGTTIAGIVIVFAVGLFELWMTALMILVVIFVISVKYKDTINVGRQAIFGAGGELPSQMGVDIVSAGGYVKRKSKELKPSAFKSRRGLKDWAKEQVSLRHADKPRVGFIGKSIPVQKIVKQKRRLKLPKIGAKPKAKKSMYFRKKAKPIRKSSKKKWKRTNVDGKYEYRSR